MVMVKSRKESSDRLNLMFSPRMASEVTQWREIADLATDADLARDAIDYYIMTMREIKEHKKLPGFRDISGKFEIIATPLFMRLLAGPVHSTEGEK